MDIWKNSVGLHLIKRNSAFFRLSYSDFSHFSRLKGLLLYRYYSLFPQNTHFQGEIASFAAKFIKLRLFLHVFFINYSTLRPFKV